MSNKQAVHNFFFLNVHKAIPLIFQSCQNRAIGVLHQAVIFLCSIFFAFFN